MKVLIVDDSEEVRRMIKRFVRGQVDEFVDCDDGDQALDSYRQHSPDVVLMDIKMKRVDGLEATKQLKKAFPDARVVIISQWDSPAMRKQARQSGANAYINNVIHNDQEVHSVR
jgi:CheY-like chemotaxis protein